jgi:molecular chaperone DnaK (HSP70)
VAPETEAEDMAEPGKPDDDMAYENPAPGAGAAGITPPVIKAPGVKTPPGPMLAAGFGSSPAPDPDFDAVGFDDGSGQAQEVQNVDDDDTPPSGIYVGGEEVQVIDAGALGRALAAASGLQTDHAGPNFTVLRTGLVGLDLGASVAVVAHFNQDGKHEVVPNAENELVTPAQVFFDEDGERLVGKEAIRLAPSAPDRAFSDVKTLLGDSKFNAKIGGSSVNAEDVLAVVARRLLDDVEQRTGSRPTHAALAAPAWFLEPQRQALKRAVEKAGIEVVGVADEPLAATVPYSLQLRDLNPRRAVVFDLGHSGLGCAVVQCARGDIEILAADARRDLGATRFDDVIAGEGARHFKEQHGFDVRDDKGANFDLRIRAEECKKALSARPAFTMVVSARGKTSKIAFARAAFEEATRPIVEEARAFLVKIRDRAGVSDWKSIDAVILTGGGTRIPMVRRMVVQETGREPMKGINPDEGVAIGALYWGLFARSKAVQEAKGLKTKDIKKRS